MQERTTGIRMLTFGVCCGVFALGTTVAAQSTIGSTKADSKGVDIWYLNSPLPEWDERPTRGWDPGRDAPSDSQAHTDQPREIGQGTEAPPSNDKPEDDEGPNEDAKSRDLRFEVPFSDLITTDFIEIDKTLVRDTFEITPRIDFNSSPDVDPIVMPENLPAPGAITVPGLAAAATLRRRRR